MTRQRRISVAVRRFVRPDAASVHRRHARSIAPLNISGMLAALARSTAAAARKFIVDRYNSRCNNDLRANLSKTARAFVNALWSANRITTFGAQRHEVFKHKSPKKGPRNACGPPMQQTRP